MSNDNVIKRLAPIFERVDRQIRDHLTSTVPLVAEISEYILLSGGKRLRPALFVLSAGLCGYQGPHDYYLSSAFEYLHAATLLHDDVVDQGDTRRGKTAAHLVYGNPGAILVGDFLLAKSMSLATVTGQIEFTEVMSETVGLMAEGEVLQLMHSRNPDIGEEEYNQVIYRKTGALIQSACYLGSVLARAPEDRRLALRTYGRCIGQAFQIIDDLLDYVATTEEFGKPVGHDLDEGKVTLPLIRTLAQAGEEERALLIDLIKKEKRTPEEFRLVLDVMERYDGLGQTRLAAREAVESAKEALAPFPEGPIKNDLRDLADFIIARKK
ncbi:MAG: polyprenyl synthetase family protein [Pseudomonadota bacterium]